MSVGGVLGEGRHAATVRFTETFDVYTEVRTVGEDGRDVVNETVLYEDVSGQVKYPSSVVSQRIQGGQVPAVQDTIIKVAVGATPDVVTDVLWRVVSSSVDAALVGRVFRTKGEPQSGQVTAHRYPVERVT